MAIREYDWICNVSHFGIQNETETGLRFMRRNGTDRKFFFVRISFVLFYDSMCVIQGLVIASLIPDCEVVICDINKDSIDIAKKRIRDAGLSNVTTICCDIRDLMKEKKKAFTLGIALHACGGLSDLCMKLCCESNAAFVVCPCCVGKLKHTCAKSKFFERGQSSQIP